jgi:hypothetical protein
MNRVHAAAKSDLNLAWYTGSDPCFTALQDGQVDVMQWPLTEPQKALVEADPDLQLAAFAENGMFELDLNNNYTINDYPTSLNPLSIEECRQAVAFLFDKDFAISNILHFYGTRIDAPVCFPQTTGWVNASVVSFDWDGSGVVEPDEDNYPYKHNPNAAAALLAGLGFNDTDGNGWINYPDDPMWLDAAGKDTTEMPLKVCIRIEDTVRQGYGELIESELENDLAAAVWPVGFVGGGWKTTGAAYEALRAVLSPIVMAAHNYHIYTGGWSLGRYPTYLFSLYSSMFWYGGGSNYVTGEGPDSPHQAVPSHYAHPDYDAVLRPIYYTDSIANAQTASLLATGYHVQHCVSIPLFSYTSYYTWRKEMAAVVNMEGVGIINDYTFLADFRKGGGPVTVGIANTWGVMNPLYSQWYFEYTWLDRISGGLISVNPYNLATDIPWMAKDWKASTWTDPRDGNEKTVVTFYLRSDAGAAAPVTGDFAGYFNVTDYEFSVWYNYRYDDDWQQSNFMDVHHLEVVDPYTVKVYFDDVSYWFTYAAGYPLIGPAKTLEPLLCTSTTSTFLGSDLAAVGVDPSYFEYQFTSECLVHVISATSTLKGALTEGVDFYIRAGYDVSPAHSVFVNLTNFAPTDSISITYYYANPDGSGGTFLGSNTLGANAWEQTEYAYNTHYPVDLSEDAAAMDVNPYFFLSPIQGEIDWRWTTINPTGPYPHSGYFQIFITDIVRCTAAYCSRGDGTWNPAYFPGADLDASDLCHIGILDLVTITGTYGQKFGTPPP